GQLSGLNHGITINQVAPEAFEGGPIALVADGDRIAIDIASRSLSLEVAEAELARRREALAAARPTAERGWLSVFQRLSGPIHRGATLAPD
ncbi:MAG TPA: dihydroxy-acid dehydratase, partial [Amaricoccus sp.]|uniref:dihydroxy-acid dehydratase domain-containing protein n=1 Tax=Amaricoccus sp. TaxID=1872485 RepID=UPI002BB7E2FA